MTNPRVIIRARKLTFHLIIGSLRKAVTMPETRYISLPPWDSLLVTVTYLGIDKFEWLVVSRPHYPL